MKKNDTITCISWPDRDHFAQPILDKLSFNVVNKYSVKNLRTLLNTVGAKNIWMEWANHPAIIVSRYKRPWQKLLIRLHRYEMYREDWMNRINWKNVDLLVFINSDLEDHFKKSINSSVNTITIPNAVDINAFPQTERGNKNSLLAYSLKYDAIKNYPYLIKFFAKIIEKNDNFSLTISARQPELDTSRENYEECHLAIREYGLENYVNLEAPLIQMDQLKDHPNINNLLSRHNAIMSFSGTESFHYAFAEGLLSGLSGFCRGWRELKPEQFWGPWCYQDEQAMLKAILAWGKTSIEERNIEAQINRSFVERNFSSEVISKQYEAIFMNL